MIIQGDFFSVEDIGSLSIDILFCNIFAHIIAHSRVFFFLVEMLLHFCRIRLRVFLEKNENFLKTT